ncbi:MAG: hypothetical protein RXO54_05590, partial [Acidilobus sp.]
MPLAFLASGGESTSRRRSSSSSTSAFLSLRTASSALSTPTSYREAPLRSNFRAQGSSTVVSWRCLRR